MKHKNSIYYILLAVTTLLMMWLLPVLVKKITYKPDSYDFVYYSSLLEDLCLIRYSDKENPVRDTKGNTYTTARADSILPLLYYRQLMSDGTLPDSIKGHEINPRIIRSKSFSFRYAPQEMQSPRKDLYILLESMPKRVGLTMPDDVFRIKSRIEFIDTGTNSVDAEKSGKFQKELEKKGYAFPTRWAAGNPNTKKAYDEGYFCLDANGQLFHLKMVNGRPYIRNTGIGDTIDIAWFSTLEVADKRFYGFLFSKQGEVFIVQNEGGDYSTLPLDIRPVDLRKDQVIIMGNLLYWTVSVITPEGKQCYGLHNETLKSAGEHFLPREPGKWDKVSRWSFPLYITPGDRHTNFLTPVLHFTGLNGFVMNFILAIFVGVMSKTGRKRAFNIIYVLLTGVAGWVSLWILPGAKGN